MARVRVLERQVAFLLKINGLNLSEFRTMSDGDLMDLYRSAVQMVDDRKFNLELIETWSETFMQVSEVEMVRLQPMVEYDHTWEPFYLLCVRMATTVRVHPKLPESMRVQHLYAALDKGRRNIRECALMMIQKFPKTLSRKARAIAFDEDLAYWLPE